MVTTQTMATTFTARPDCRFGSRYCGDSAKFGLCLVGRFAACVWSLRSDCACVGVCLDWCKQYPSGWPRCHYLDYDRPSLTPFCSKSDKHLYCLSGFYGLVSWHDFVICGITQIRLDYAVYQSRCDGSIYYGCCVVNYDRSSQIHFRAECAR